MNNPDIIINVIGIAYGLVLILTTFVRNRITEAMRVDALFLKQASEQTRPLNLIFGILVAGYGIYSLIG
ncbi:MAG: hypothetical protein WC029_11980 [Sulfuricella sp.]